MPRTDSTPVTSRRMPVLFAGIGVVAVLALIATVLPSGQRSGSAAPPTIDATTTPSSAPTTVPGSTWGPTTPDPDVEPVPAAAGQGAAPVSVEIPDIGVRSDLISLDVDPGTRVLIPPERYDIAGWFTGGPVPGDVGPSIIAGHVDSRAGPGVFYRLEEMRAGQTITVTRADGDTVEFTVLRVEQYPKADFPTARVYGPTPDRELRLITCGGDFDRSRRSYLDNIVVYAVQTQA
ncbi:hypothetical protein BH20ACT5_BH20ACT5_24900 [soil metagenome]